MIADRSRSPARGIPGPGGDPSGRGLVPGAGRFRNRRPRGGPPQVWAVLVGIERYEDEVRFPRSRGAARDAVAMARWLIEEAGWGRDHVRLLIDREPSEPVHFRNPDLRPDRPETDAGARSRARSPTG